MVTPTSLVCTDAVATFLGLFDFSIAPKLLFYSYIPIALFTIFICAYILYKNRFSTQSILITAVGAGFSLFLLNELVLWTAVPVPLVYFSWQLAILLRIAITVSVLLFIYYFSYKKLPSTSENSILALTVLPIVLFLGSPLNTPAFNITTCEGINGPLWTYLNFVEIIALISISIKTFFDFKTYRANRNSENLKIIYITSASLIFLIIFIASQQYGEYFGVYEVNLFGPLGMFSLIGILGYASSKYSLFKVKLVAPVAFVFALWGLVFSLLFVHDISTIRLVVSLTLVGSILSGLALIHSLRREIKQRNQIEKLAATLEKANVRLMQVDKLKSEFVSIASHQLRSPLTSISGYASLLREGTYGTLPSKMKEPVERIEQSARLMAESIEDYLNVSRIESGNMKYHLVDFNLRDTTEHVADDNRPEALKNGLIVLFKSKLTAKGIVHADLGKVQQIIHNLLNNAIKYTERGTITVFVHDDATRKKIWVDVLDTGIGMSTETLHSIFQKFERGDKANTVNVKGTGLGLYVALKMAEAMGGTVTAYSEGEGKGSRFTFELPLQM